MITASEAPLVIKFYNTRKKDNSRSRPEKSALYLLKIKIDKEIEYLVDKFLIPITSGFQHFFR
jgi:hypothetical protein